MKHVVKCNRKLDDNVVDNQKDHRYMQTSHSSHPRVSRSSFYVDLPNVWIIPGDKVAVKGVEIAFDEQIICLAGEVRKGKQELCSFSNIICSCDP